MQRIGEKKKKNQTINTFKNLRFPPKGNRGFALTGTIREQLLCVHLALAQFILGVLVKDGLRAIKSVYFNKAQVSIIGLFIETKILRF